ARAEEQARQATLERARAEEQAQRAQVAEEQAALERTKVEKLLELLLQKGINPNDLI
ncbi:MAG: Uma2 family endonuclease, partial [Chloroflexi bacterium]|nr:Uma2 family endonuclease [Chloroflexota bacterium]